MAHQMTGSFSQGASSPTPVTPLANQRIDVDGSPLVSIHKRTYQACIPCRRRKVRCDLGPVDNPHEPPCVRCRRESKECYFSATRRKRRADSGEDIPGEKATQDDYALYNRRRKTSSAQDLQDASLPRNFQSQASAGSVSQSPTSVGQVYNWNSHERTQQTGLYAESKTPSRANTPGDQEVTNEAAAALFQSPINQPADALHLLLEASGRTGDLHRQSSINQGDQKMDESGRRAPNMSTKHHRSMGLKTSKDLQHQQDTMNIDPAIAGDMGAAGSEDDSNRLREKLKIWSRLRFVRAGWFTAMEAMSYIDYFYEYLAPLTPISPPDFRQLATISNLLSEEPLLTVTILTISSRYKRLPGPGGQSRSFIIHDRLWGRLQCMISRMFFSQESFGGGLNGAGPRTLDQGRLRALGTIESLLLLSEFHPRSMHFPPGDDGDEILAPTDADAESLLMTDDEAQKGLTTGQATLKTWTEPALRSDRMCWSLIGAAHTLAYELGLFGSFADSTVATCPRARRLERLLYVYISQTSGRLGLASMFRDIPQEGDFAYLQQILFQRNARNPQELDDVILSCWVEITSIMRVSNLRLFPSKLGTMNLIRSGEYFEILQEFQPLLHAWWKKFESLDLPDYPRIILSIEFEYACVYMNSLALQAVLDQWTSNVAQAPTQHLSSLYWQNEVYVKEVVRASRNLLRQVVDGLLPDDYLKHVPVRTFFRVLSGAMFLLKSFALGAKENEVKTSLDLLDRTIKALRTSVVDDVHLCLRIADLLEGLTTSVRHKFVRLAGHSADRAAQQDNMVPSDSGGPPYLNVQTPEGFIRPDAPTPNNDTSMRYISIMPPPTSAYNVPSNYTFSPIPQLSPAPIINQSQSQSQAPQQHLYPTSNLANLSGTADDWLTLDLNPLLDNSAFGGADNPWFGNFGPEINSNLDVLGRLVNEQFMGEGFDEGEMGF